VGTTSCAWEQIEEKNEATWDGGFWRRAI